MRQLLAAGAHSILDLFPLVRVARVPFAGHVAVLQRQHAGRLGRRRSAGWAAAPSRPGKHRPAQTAGGPVILGVVGRPDSGKTTLIERLIPEFTRRGLRVGAVKRVAKFDIDMPGKDSWRHGQAGADAYTVASASKLAFVARRDEEASLEEIVARYFGGYDVVVCEGYRREAPDVVEVFRAGAGYESTGVRPRRAAGARHRRRPRPRAPLRRSTTRRRLRGSSSSASASRARAVAPGRLQAPARRRASRRRSP